MQRNPLFSRIAAVIALLVWAANTSAEKPENVARQIREEAARANDSDAGRPLPLASHWNVGSTPPAAGWAPSEQMRMIEEGHYLLPWFAHPRFQEKASDEAWERFAAYYQRPIQRARELGLPLCFKGTQWERYLSDEPYRSLPPEQNPNVIRPDGKVLRKVSPFGPVEPWKEIGARWTSNAGMKRLEQWYPDPPLVVFLSNNEHSKLRWHQMGDSQRYQDRYGEGRDEHFKRQVVADGWIERYRALQDGMRQGLDSPHWKENAVFVGYGAFGPSHMGRWGGWPAYSLHSPGRISPYPLMWDGGSPSYYTHDWDPSTDHTTWSPQVQFMNLVFMHDEALRLNPNFRLEMSVWDGGDKEKSPRALYRLAGQTYNPTRYAGFVQFGMWLVRPRVVREFRGHVYPSEDGMPYFMALVEAVDRVHNTPTLRDFWRQGRLVPNRAHQHPYQAGIPEEYREEDRWFLLDADTNPKLYPWDLHWDIPVFSLALVQGEAPRRRWLIYAHSPREDRQGVTLTIPEYEDVTVDVSVAGSFHVVDEKSGSVKPVL